SVNSNFILHSKGDGHWDHQAAGTGRTFNDIWGSGPTDVYAVEGGASHSVGDGVWPEPAQHVAIDGEPILAIWGSSATDVYAAGAFNRVYHSTGNGTWRDQSTSAMNLQDIWGTSSHDIYTISTTQVFHSTGDGNWRDQPVSLLSGEHML